MFLKRYFGNVSYIMKGQIRADRKQCGRERGRIGKGLWVGIRSRDAHSATQDIIIVIQILNLFLFLYFHLNFSYNFMAWLKVLYIY